MPVMIPSATVIMPAICIPSVETFMFETFVVKASAVEVSNMLSFKIRAVVREVETVPVMSVPGRVTIISITGEFVFVHYGCRSTVSILADWCWSGIFILVYRRGRCILILVNYRCGPGDNDPGRTNAEAEMG